MSNSRQLHRATEEHHHSVAREAHEHAEHALRTVVSTGTTPLSAATALQLAATLGVTTEEAATTVLQAQPASHDQLEALAKVNVLAIAAAFTPEVVQHLLSGAVRVTATNGDALGAAAERIRALATAIAALRNTATRLHGSARVDAELLDAVVEQVYPQLAALGAVDAAALTPWLPLTSYREHRHKGGHHKTPPTPATPAAGQ